MRLSDIAGFFREWAVERREVNVNLTKCNRTYTRFTTAGMSAILPDIPNAPSAWNTENHYFYELMNRNGRSAYIQLSISAQNITDEFRAVCDRINQFYPAKADKEEWQYRLPFRTKTFAIEEVLSKEAIFASLDSCLDEILAFEADLAKQLHI